VVALCRAAVLFALFVVGGATRLTGSGLSITEWQPVHGVIPPLTEAQWLEELEKYRQIPQYQEINRGMSLDEFKVIFWWEWAHRALARGVGLVFALPLAFFWLTGRLESHLKPKLLVLLALGGLQGFIGWWMVASGLSERVSVSQYRLAVHLTLACIIFAAIMWVARGLRPIPRHRPETTRADGRPLGGSGAGADLSRRAGGGPPCRLIYNTWPLMDGACCPTSC
jgi:heme a synthase